MKLLLKCRYPVSKNLSIKNRSGLMVIGCSLTQLENHVEIRVNHQQEPKMYLYLATHNYDTELMAL